MAFSTEPSAAPGLRDPTPRTSSGHQDDTRCVWVLKVLITVFVRLRLVPGLIYEDPFKLNPEWEDLFSYVMR